MNSACNDKIICNKKDIMLKLNTINEIYSINLRSKIGNLDLKNFFNFNIYKIIFELNKDVIEDIKIVKEYDENNIDLLIIFKRLMSTSTRIVTNEFSIPMFYMYVTVSKICNNDNNSIVFNSKENTNELSLIDTTSEEYERLTCEYSELTITNLENDNNIDINFDFKFSYINNSSRFFKNFIALLIKKVFYKLKLFIDNQLLMIYAENYPNN